MGHLEGNFTPVLFIGRKVPKELYNFKYLCVYVSGINCEFTVVHLSRYLSGKPNVAGDIFCQ